jgi:hypothetical protein
LAPTTHYGHLVQQSRSVLGDLASARTLFERALNIGQATLGPNHPDMAALCDNLDDVLQQLGGE